MNGFFQSIELARIAEALNRIAAALEVGNTMEKAQTENSPGPSVSTSGAHRAQEESTPEPPEASTPAWCKADSCQDPRQGSPAHCKFCPQCDTYVQGVEKPDPWEDGGLM